MKYLIYALCTVLVIGGFWADAFAGNSLLGRSQQEACTDTAATAGTGGGVSTTANNAVCDDKTSCGRTYTYNPPGFTECVTVTGYCCKDQIVQAWTQETSCGGDPSGCEVSAAVTFGPSVTIKVSVPCSPAPEPKCGTVPPWVPGIPTGE